jgi:hypothetical protein
MTIESEFREIAHSGGTVTIILKIVEGQPRYSQMWRHCRPSAAVIFAVWALPQGVAIAQSDLGGIGQAVAGPPIPGCFQVFVGSDSEGKFGHQCPSCGGYWRSGVEVNFCPYCGQREDVVAFLTAAQRSYIAEYCAKFSEFMTAQVEGECVIDMDAVADAAGSNSPKPAFYYAEQTQQNRFTCSACGSFNDILGTYGYCSACSTRNNLQELSEKVLPSLRSRINDEHQFESSAKDAVGAFDSFVGSYIKELVDHIPLTEARRKRLTNRLFHNLKSVADDLKEIFDINILRNTSADDIAFAIRMFHRRHVYEHKGGEADQKYIDDSGDDAVRPKQALRESAESAHRIIGIVQKMASNLHEGFHELAVTHPVPIERHRRRNMIAR